jgi:hypothetical protein
MKGQLATGLIALAAMGAAPDAQVSSINHDRMPVGQAFLIETEDQVYRGQLIDRRTGECQMTILNRGETAAPSRTVYLLGATAGPQDRQMLVLMHQVKVGLRMELGLDDLEQKNRIITGEVKAITLLR